MGYSDSDWARAGDVITRWFHFRSGKLSDQAIVALSTEAEYMALTNATQEALWIRSFLKEFRFSMNMPTTL
jgi:hypothetical protein